MANQWQRPGFTVGSLAHSVRVAAEILQRVAVQVHEPSGLATTVAEQASELDTLLPALDSIEDEGRRSASVWTLDNAWINTAFAVAATRPRVLLTIATNAVGALQAEFDDALKNPWSQDVRQILEGQQEALKEVRARLVAARVTYLAPPEEQSR